VQVVVEVGAPGDVLVRHADGASLLVVGSRSRSRLAGMVLGSVALHCAVHARCPVLVVRPEPDRAATPEQPAAARAGR
jgi:nucleotide-binding universal stress UspA family protein